MRVLDLEEGLSIFKDAYSDVVKSAYVDDYNGESASIVITFYEDANLKSLNPTIKRFFRYFIGEIVFPNEFGSREDNMYMFDSYYLYKEANYEYLDALKSGNEMSFIKQKRKEDANKKRG